MTRWQNEFISSADHINASEWNTLFKGQSIFLRHEFLSALEESGCVRDETGWQPHHLVLRDCDNSIVALVPLYIKTNSRGEYVFDWSWAEAYQRYGFPYYPKLVTAIPFTPCTGTRFGIRDDIDDINIISHLVDLIKAEVKELEASSWHCLFLSEFQSKSLVNSSISQRIGCQYHWHNKGFQNFNEFLDTFSSRKRKNLRKERMRVQEEGVELHRKVGGGITQFDWINFYNFYQDTYLKYSGGKGYLNETFFKMLMERLPDSIMMVTAEKSGNMIAGALFFFDEHTLYGRYWGCQEEVEFLHFEACYYQGIEFAIERGLEQFDPGAQGEHKIQRGFNPRITYSNHFIAEPAFAKAIENYLVEERLYIENYCLNAQKFLPFRQ